ncbi:hypothetical protein RFI_29283 [Reticulomyxa filosa]|uniref:VPS9 domain-containing protein n=1 Tax=Reticulomyxa filosa TaxID=46433 RepID=X6M4Z3_RETFI|nr:hypothetical protein RFI_29283 [Reticulomyxa filosa]|eukprot:ETO08105.1 hypothetical protein RFI_29283 [Reticulomyxa filosa]
MSFVFKLFFFFVLFCLLSIVVLKFDWFELIKKKKRLWKIKMYQNPLDKAMGLVKMKELIIRCIDQYRTQNKVQTENFETGTDTDRKTEEEDKKENDNMLESTTASHVKDASLTDYSLIEPIVEHSAISDKQALLMPNSNYMSFRPDDEGDFSIIPDDAANYCRDTHVVTEKVEQKAATKDPKRKEVLMYEKKQHLYISFEQWMSFRGADDMIPLFAYTLVKSQLPSVYAEIAFVENFLDGETDYTEAGFSLS